MVRLSVDSSSRVNDLSERYATSLPARVSRLRQAWANFRAGDKKALQTAHDEAHTLAGSAATFGFAELGEQARRVMRDIEVSMMTSEAKRGDQLTAIEGLLSQFDRLLGESRAPRPLAIASAEPSSEPFRVDGPKDLPLVYVLDDDVVHGEFVALQLTQFGYRARQFSSTDETKCAIVEQRPDALVIDAVMPGGELDGLQMLHELRRLGYGGIPSIVITVRSDMIARLEAVRAGTSAYLTKPIDVIALVDRLDELTSTEPSTPYRVVVIDDESEVASYHALILQQAGMQTAVTTEPLEAMALVTEFRPDLVLMDIAMPECTGLELATLFRQQELFASVPIVFLSQDQNADRRLAALAHGGDDFLLKPIAPEHLVTAVTARARRSRWLRNRIARDSLTGLLNHASLRQEFEFELSRARRQRTPVAFAMLDVDHFKLVNDTYGHAAGDRVLEGLARLLKQGLRSTDILGRYGGEEFAIILPNTDEQEAVHVLERLRESFSQIRFSQGHPAFSSSFSCGVAAYPAINDASLLRSAADAALYRAKALGRNRIERAEQAAH